MIFNTAMIFEYIYEKNYKHLNSYYFLSLLYYQWLISRKLTSCHLSSLPGLILATGGLAAGAAAAAGEGPTAAKRAAATAESGTGAGARAATGIGRRRGTEEETETRTERRTRVKKRQTKRGK